MRIIDMAETTGYITLSLWDRENIKKQPVEFAI
jgi:hypothetical protein